MSLPHFQLLLAKGRSQTVKARLPHTWLRRGSRRAAQSAMRAGRQPHLAAAPQFLPQLLHKSPNSSHKGKRGVSLQHTRVQVVPKTNVEKLAAPCCFRTTSQGIKFGSLASSFPWPQRPTVVSVNSETINSEVGLDTNSECV